MQQKQAVQRATKADACSKQRCTARRMSVKCFHSVSLFFFFFLWFELVVVWPLFNKPPRFNETVHAALIKPNWGSKRRWGGTEWQLHKLVFSIHLMWRLEIFLFRATVINVNYSLSLIQLLNIFGMPPPKKRAPKHICRTCQVLNLNAHFSNFKCW